jgi:hypothetical protein
MKIEDFQTFNNVTQKLNPIDNCIVNDNEIQTSGACGGDGAAIAFCEDGILLYVSYDGGYNGGEAIITYNQLKEMIEKFENKS